MHATHNNDSADVFVRAPVAAVLVDEAGGVSRRNDAFVELMSRTTLASCEFERLADIGEVAATAAARAEWEGLVTAVSAGREAELASWECGGPERHWLRVRAHPATVGAAAPMCVCWFTDITREVVAERTAATLAADFASPADNARMMETFDEIGRSLLDELELESVLSAIGNELIRAGIFDNVTISLIDRVTGRIEVVRGFHAGLDGGPVVPFIPAPVGLRHDLTTVNPYSRAAWSGRPQVACPSEFSAHLPTSDDATQVDVLIPVKKDRVVVAILGTTCADDAQADVLARVDSLAPLLRLIAIAVEHACLYVSTQSSQQELRHVVSSARCLLWSGTVREIDGVYEWDLEPFDETAAQRLLPLDIPDGMDYGDVWHEAVSDEDRARMNAVGAGASVLATRAVRAARW